ncbi:hypothetical protein FB45DRAFT_910396 [Roridomyces roridus]|uniref:Mid2 domain-containing protein n=1 Tax=Roridomyces roridus TaxID=1738132 RepID=A0AAD7BZR4_9AGAR|nr:hypothetical protein FB45DRAFT_910396 [Roridomyces roridus]
MPTLKILLLLISLSGLVAAQDAPTAVTLWQFGQGRLLEASVTLPLIPLGTARGGSATTYLYQALNNKLVTTTDASGLEITTNIPFPTPHTIIASASGWVEPFADNSIICNLVNSDFGDCFLGGTVANSGKPTPEVIAISQSATPPSFATITANPPISSIKPTSTVPSPAISIEVLYTSDSRQPISPPASSPGFTPASPFKSSNTASSSASSSSAVTTSGIAVQKKSKAGVIAGGVIGGIVILLGLLLFIIWLHRTRVQMVTPFDGSPMLETAETPRPFLSLPARKGWGQIEGLATYPTPPRAAISTSESDFHSPTTISPISVHSPYSTTTFETSTRASGRISANSRLAGQMVEIADRLRRLEERLP